MANHGYMPGACLNMSEQTMYDPIKNMGAGAMGFEIYTDFQTGMQVYRESGK
ncbi:hypothetical protein HUS84_21305 [Pseudomonas chlororaphis]|uniref:hypothetical protein n=1 Tax=Pseudomonas chlororaphis TaxID=587753 RepID=UPI001B330749|nr:hypothetical protein [Pseudomonas chlororaphis]MBP5076474.1 hypothetical protein [Pseudomonas chlororaphis]